MFSDSSSASQSHLQPQRFSREILTHLFSETEGLYDFSSRSHSKFQSTLKSEPMNHRQLPVVLNVSRWYLSRKCRGVFGVLFVVLLAFSLLLAFFFSYGVLIKSIDIQVF